MQLARTDIAVAQFLCERIHPSQPYLGSGFFESVDFGMRHLPPGIESGRLSKQYVFGRCVQ